MSARDSVGAGRERAAGPIAEREARSAPGVPVLIAGIVMLVAAIVLLVAGIALGAAQPGPASLILLAGLPAVAGYLTVRGLTPVVAGEARVIQLFGSSHGTIREAGLHWVNPFAKGELRAQLAGRAEQVHQ